MSGPATRVAVLAGLGLAALLAACGHSSPSAGVAHIGATTTAGNGFAGPSVSSVSGLQPAQLAFARCMRSHGVPSYPDPGSQGQLATSKAEADGELSVNSPQFRAGLRRCRSFLPTSTPASPAQQAAVTAKAVKFAECMRAHGLLNFPDPGAAPSGRKLPSAGYFVAAESGPLSPSNPRFVRAQKACSRVAGGIY